jgi:hypothetical protein
MELTVKAELTDDEVKEAILDWAERRLPSLSLTGKVYKVDLPVRYSYRPVTVEAVTIEVPEILQESEPDQEQS